MSLLEEKQKIDNSAIACDQILFSLVNECVSDLDSYIVNISTNFKDSAMIDNLTLDNFILNIPMLIYYTVSKLEQLGLKDDLSEIEKKSQLSRLMSDTSITVKNKTQRQLMTEIESIDISILNNIYQRAYKIVKNKIDIAYEVLASCKKIMSRRIEELKVENSDTGRQLLKS